MSHRTHPPLLSIAAMVAVLAGTAIAVPAAATDRLVVVQPGDTLSEIALHFGVSVDQLQALNGISNPNRIFAGQRLRVTGQTGTEAATPSPRQPVVHVVASGENLTGIARRYGSTIAAIAKANRIANPSYLRTGQRLTIPGTAAPAAPASAQPAKAPAPVVAPTIHLVAGGENLTGIARRYGSTVAAIAKANGIVNASYVRTGQRLTIPDTGAPVHATSAVRMPGGMSSLVAARSTIGDIIRAEATARGVPVPFAMAVAWQESGWQAGVVSRAGAVGVMQLTPPTVSWVASTMLGHKIDPYDARSNVQAGVTLLRHYLDRYHGDRSLTLAAYYQGQTAADRYGIYRMTRPYIASITALEQFFGN